MKKILHNTLIACLILTGLMAVTSAGAETYHVNQNGGNDTNDGLSWANAFETLQKALETAQADDDIYIASGTYKPSSHNGIEKSRDNDPDLNARDYTFLITKDVNIYGGFNADNPEDAPENRDPANQATILSGDLDDDGNFSEGDAYHVVLAVGSSDADRIAPLFDGLTIMGGYASDPNSWVTVNNLPFYRGNGAGIYNCYADTRLQQVEIKGNKSNDIGAGIYSNNSSPVLTNVTIAGNQAENGGGGILNFDSSPILTNVTIAGNKAGDSGGGGIYNLASSPVLTNVTITGNKAGNGGGGGIYNFGSSSPQIRNSILWGNRADDGGSNVDNGGSTPTFSYSLIEGCNEDGFWDNMINGGDNIDPDPLFVSFIDPSGTGWQPTTGGDYRLQTGSPAIDAGSDTYYQSAEDPDLSAITTDLDGNPRFMGAAIDMGAYEKVVETPSPGTYHTVTLAVAHGISCNYRPGQLTVEDGDYLHLQFSAEEQGISPDDILFRIDGIDTAFRTAAEGSYGYILSPIYGNHTIVIALRHYSVTLPEVEGATTDPAAGEHPAPYGEPFNFTLRLNDFNDFENIKVYANDTELTPRETGHPLSLQYTIDAVTGPLTITIEGVDPVSNTDIAAGKISVAVESGQLRVHSSLPTPADITVYVVTGQVIATRRVHTSETIPLSPGIYLVRTPEDVHKVVIR